MDINTEISSSCSSSSPVCESAGTDFLKSMAELWLSGTVCDGVVVASDGQSLKVHVVFVVGHSDYFKKLFDEAIVLQPQYDVLTVHVREVTGLYLQMALEWVYTRNVRLSEDRIEALFKAAVLLEIEGLKEDCAKWCLQNLTPKNCFRLLALVDREAFPKIHSEIKKYYLKHFEEIVHTSPDFLEMDIHGVFAFLDSEGLNAKNELLVWEAAVKWIDKVPERQKYTEVLLETVRWGLLTNEEMEDLKSHNLIVKLEKCKDTIKWRSRKRNEPRIPHEVILVIGGYSNDMTNSMEVYDVRSDRWSLIESRSNDRRVYHGQAVLGDTVYIIGGYLSGFFNPRTYTHLRTCTNTCLAYNYFQRRWKEVSCMYESRAFPSVAVLDEYIYVLGGLCGEHGIRLRTVERYDRSTNQWEERGLMNVPRSNAGCAVLNGKIYICGGFDGATFHDSAEVYDCSTDTWSIIASMSVPRAGLGCAVVNGYVYVFGGITTGFTTLQSAERYDPLTLQWMAIPDMPQEKSNASTEVLEGRIYIIGGFADRPLSTVDCFDPMDMEWKSVARLVTETWGSGACIISGVSVLNRFYVVRREVEDLETEDSEVE